MRRQTGVLPAGMWLGCRLTAYECEVAADSIDGEIEGVCQNTGFCSFPDTVCPSGQRYGARAVESVAKECVPPGDDATSIGGEPEADTGTSDAGSPMTPHSRPRPIR